MQLHFHIKPIGFMQLLVSCLALLDKLINPGELVTTTRHTWINQVCPIMADRKQGAGWSSGSSAAVHKANC